MRLFIAIEPPTELQERAFAMAGPLREAGADVKWVRPEQLHYTLKFLGEVPDERAKEIEERLRQLLAGAKAFSVHIAGAGYFGSEKFPRVLWFGVTEGREELVALMEKIGTAFADVRKDEFAANAHLTIGRVNGSARKLVDALEKLKDAEVGAFFANEVVVKRSALARTGPIYSTVAKVGLA